uniref:Type II/IV secretion system protein n=1 Tax=candidate division CPR3 bacterium TaxID=2268181 RepID=A0A7C4LZC7_UNCC3
MENQNNQQKSSFSNLLLERGLVSADIIAKAQDLAVREGAFFEDALLALDALKEEDLAKIVAEFYGLPYIDVSSMKIPFIVLSKFPEEISRKYNIVVFETMGDQMMKVAISKPWDSVTRKALDFIKTKNNINIDPYVATMSGLQKAWEQYKNPVMVEKQGSEIEKEEKKESVVVTTEAKVEKEEMEASQIATLVPEDVSTQEELSNIIKNSTVPRIVAAIIKHGVSIKASDIHIEPLEGKDTRIRYRVDGILSHIADIARKDHAALIARVKILAKLKIDEQRIPQDGRIDVVFGDKAIDLRISTFPTIDGEKVVMRILDKSSGIVKIEEIGMVGRTYEKFLEAIKIPHGILLVTGPTGSGKSTTIYAAISRINQEGINIVTLEDPVEYQMAGVNQSQVKPYIGYDFANGLRFILRQDPNVIMVGEIRDRETAEMAVQSSLTGHLVMSTLHTNDAAGAIPRLIDMGVEPFLISSSVHTIVGQRLVRKICPDCKKEIEIPESVYNDMKREFEIIPDQYKQDLVFNIEDRKMYSQIGCAKCNNSGYSGRIGIFELLSMSEKIKSLSIERASASEILNQAISEGMITMKQDGILKVLRGVTTMDEVYRVTTLL